MKDLVKILEEVNNPPSTSSPTKFNVTADTATTPSAAAKAPQQPRKPTPRVNCDDDHIDNAQCKDTLSVSSGSAEGHDDGKNRQKKSRRKHSKRSKHRSRHRYYSDDDKSSRSSSDSSSCSSHSTVIATGHKGSTTQVKDKIGIITMIIVMTIAMIIVQLNLPRWG